MPIFCPSAQLHKSLPGLKRWCLPSCSIIISRHSSGPAHALLFCILDSQGLRHVLCLQVGPQDHVICALSGGVDSTVAATLVHQVLGDRLHCVFVDNGLLRYKVSSPPLCACTRSRHSHSQARGRFPGQIMGFQDLEDVE